MDLQAFFRENSSVALAFSGGVDSSYLLYAGLKYGADIKAYFVKTAFQPAFELRDAQRLAAQLGARMAVVEKDVLSERFATENPADRCYYCKRVIFETLVRVAADDGYTVLIDGTNASDDASDRPGMRALRELSVRSPLRECGLTKDAIRTLSKDAGLPTWNKSAYACLATRVPTGGAITSELLRRVEGAEDALFALGFSDFRVRIFEESARLQFPADQMPAALEKRELILCGLKPFFSVVLLDLDVR